MSEEDTDHHEPGPGTDDARKRPRRVLRWTLLAILLACIAIQFVPVDRSNPPVRADLAEDGELEATLRQSCYDCHSNETTWPWYAYVAPVSWYVAHDVEEGREHLNFSNWGEMPADEQAEMAHEAWEEVEEGEMPLGEYLWTHGDAELNDADRAAIRGWAQSHPGGHEHEHEH